MNLAKKLNKLQEIDLEIRRYREEINRIDANLSENSELIKLKHEYSTLISKISNLRQSKKDFEWEIEDLNKNISTINSKLYGGTIKNPKELLNLQQDVAAIKHSLNKKEDLLLEVMENEEALQSRLNELNRQLKYAEEQWSKQSEELHSQKPEYEGKLENLNEERKSHIVDIDPAILQIYDRLLSKKGLAVVRVEQGRCQGCRISLPMNDQQRARAGDLVYCSSCGMILCI